MHAYVYKSLKKAETYAYLARRDDFDCLPEPVRKQLGELRDQGILTEEEFAVQKAKVLNS